MFDNAWFYVALAAIAFIGVTKSGFGSGVGLIIVPMMALAMGNGAFPGRGEQAALGLLLPLLVVGDLISVWQYRKYYFSKPTESPPSREPAMEAAGPALAATTVLEHKVAAIPAHSTRQVMRLLLPGTFLGVLLASLLLWWFHSQQQMVASLMRIEIGCESVLLVGLHWWRMYRGVQTRMMPEPVRGLVMGAFAGASSTLAHAAGPIIVMYLLPLKLERRLFVATCALYFFVLNSLKMPFYYQAGLFEKAELGFTVMFIPLVLAGAIFGFWVNKRMSDKLFINIVYVCTFVLGWYIMADGVMTLVRQLR